MPATTDGVHVVVVPNRNYVLLDLARGLAAVAVAAGHLRMFVLQDLRSIERANLLWKLFYALTSLGHEAVLVFFVMSGFLIGKHVHQAFNTGRWSWTDYAIKRLSRLWMVLLPALILTAVWDFIGIHFFQGPIYAGLLNDVYFSTPSPDSVGSIYRFDTFVQNALFLQTITVPTFGTNGPLWSLANEFWYYVIFPLAFLATRRHAPAVRRLAGGGLALAICLALPTGLVLYGIIWLFGFWVVLVEAHVAVQMSPGVRRSLTIAALVLFAANIAINRYVQADYSIAYPGLPDLACGITFAILLYFLTKIRVAGGILSRGSHVLSEFSYTLYLTHFPFIALLSCAVLGSARLQPGAVALGAYGALLCVTLLYAFCVYLLFERNTKSLQAFLVDRFGSGRQPRAVAAERKDAATTGD